MSEPRAEQAVMGRSRLAVEDTARRRCGSAETAALHGVVLPMAAFAYWTLQQPIVASRGQQSFMERAIKGGWNGRLSLVPHAIGIAWAFVAPWLAVAIYVLVALIWLVPDRRIERHLDSIE